ncbi:MAG: hypothetical protein ACTSWX_05695 [Promethearchaeota archaeon]
MKNVKIDKMSSKIIAILILGLICYSSLLLYNTSDYISKNKNQLNETLPRSSSFLENRTDYSKQLVKDPSFDLGYLTSPWTTEEDGDIGDIDENLDNNKANYKIIGETYKFTNISGIPSSSNWTAIHNPDLPAFPEWPYNSLQDSYGIDQEGCWANHSWREGPRQIPSVLWVQNFTMPVNMSDYQITSANVSSIINASVDSNIDVDPSKYPDETQTTQGVVYDYVRFYVSVADTSLENIYEIAYYQSSELGYYVDATNNTLDIEKYMNMVSEDNLKFYLSSVLSHDWENFTVILGMNIFCEDNLATDFDYWNSLRIKNVNFTFTYEKKIDQLTSVSWNQTGNKIDNGEYELGDDGYFIINNASLNFDFNISQKWPNSSLNSEFRFFLNNYQISKTIKIFNFSTTIQHESIDISPSLINEIQNITLKLQLYIADDFHLSNNITVTIDNVDLTTFFTVVERRNPIETKLETTTGYLSRSIHWNENFSILLNYTEMDTKYGINESNFIIQWSDSYDIQEIENGIYNLSCNNTLNVSTLPYSLKIQVNITNTWYESKTLELKIYVIGRETNLQILLGNDDISSSNKIDVPITSNLNFTLFYYDSILSEMLSDSQMSLNNLETSSFSSNHNSTTYTFIINTTKLGLGIHIASFVAEKTNYKTITKNLQINVRQIHTNVSTTNSNQSFTIERGQDFHLELYIDNIDFGGDLSGCEVSYSWKFGTGFLNETSPGTYSMTFSDVPQGIYTIYISIFKGPEYNFEPFEITLNVINPQTNDQGIPTFVFYLMGLAIVGLIASFIAYQQYFKFPKTIREIRSLNKAIKKGKAAEKELSIKGANDLFVQDYISRTKGILPSKSQDILKNRQTSGIPQKAMTKGDLKKKMQGKKLETPEKKMEKKKISSKIPKEEKKSEVPKKASILEESLDLPKEEISKKIEPTQKIEKLKPDQFVKPHDIEKSDLKQISMDQKPKKIRYLRKPKIKELPKKKTDKK